MFCKLPIHRRTPAALCLPGGQLPHGDVDGGCKHLLLIKEKHPAVALKKAAAVCERYFYSILSSRRTRVPGQVVERATQLQRKHTAVPRTFPLRSTRMTTVGKFRESARSPGSPNAERGGYWRAEPLGREHSFALNAAPRSRFEPDHLSSSPEQAIWVHAHHLSAAPKKVFARLCKNNPYIGFFHYAPSAGNRSRSTYFEQDIVSMEVIHRQHAVRSNPMIGNLHYGHDLYGERFEDFQRILAQLKAKDVERQVRAVLDRHPRPFGGGKGLGLGKGLSISPCDLFSHPLWPACFVDGVCVRVMVLLVRTAGRNFLGRKS
ncbi:unnamed protein product [Ectocarpus sp. 12 AP-2014]